MMTRSLPAFVAALATTLVPGCSESPAGLAENAIAPPVAAVSRGQPVQAGVVRAEFPDNLCGIDVSTSLFVGGSRFAATGSPTTEAGQIRVTWTNPVTGKVLQLLFTGLIITEEPSFNEDGSFTLLQVFIGQGAKLQAPAGPVLSLTGGRFEIELLFTPTAEGGFAVELLVFRILAGTGEAPVFSSAFCETVIAALT